MKVMRRLAGLGMTALAVSLLSAGPAQASITTDTVTVHATDGPPGVATLAVTAGDTLTVTAAGSAQYGYQGAGPCTGYPTTNPDGSEYLSGVYCGTVSSSDATLPSALVGELIGRISNGGGWFAIGASRTWTAGRTGTLYLAYNDSIYTDNSGHYTATLTDNSG